MLAVSQSPSEGLLANGWLASWLATAGCLLLAGTAAASCCWLPGWLTGWLAGWLAAGAWLLAAAAAVAVGWLPGWPASWPAAGMRRFLLGCSDSRIKFGKSDRIAYYLMKLG